ncbi:MAG: glycosyltransferase family protein [Magnetococcales bacterium]|nr:glycosyltransferase family protein [Magnetococcales bacterium]
MVGHRLQESVLPDYHRGGELLAEGDVEGAAAAFQEALVRGADLPEGLFNLALCYRMAGAPEEEETCYRAAIERRAEFPEAHNNLAGLLFSRGDFQQAERHYRAALKKRPDYPEALNSLATVRSNLGDFTEAAELLERAISQRPEFAEARCNRALLRLALGDYQRGWSEYVAWRFRRAATPSRPFDQPLWDGTPCPGDRLLLHAEQGFGDTIQLLRYLPMIRRRVGHLILELPGALVRLAQSMAQGRADHHLSSTVDVISQEALLPPFDLHMPLLNLPHVFSTTLDTIPAEIPYFISGVPDGEPCLAASSRMEYSVQSFDIKRDSLMISRKVHVGITWAGRATQGNDWNRSIPLESLHPLVNISNVAAHPMQKELRPGEEEVLERRGWQPYQGGGWQDFQDTAAMVVQMDLMICIDSAMAHLAGALGVPLWVLIPANHDWRWRDRQGVASPWYPQARLFVQQQVGDWSGALLELTEALKDHISRT